jgi:molybdopterin converting factor subunit 1
VQVQVKFFAIFREMLGVKTEEKTIAAGTTVEQLWKEYAARNPRATNIRAAYAVNQKLVAADYVLRDGDEVGFLPPVSGGAPQAKSKNAKVKSVVNRKDAKTAKKRNTNVIASRKAAKQSPRRLGIAASRTKDAFITRKSIDLNALYHHVSFSGAGAVLLFSGIVRDNSQGKSVDHLEYEAYPAMAEQSMHQIIDEIHAHWADVRVAMAHRIGKLKIGEASLVIAVAAPHRPEAYAASRYAIERVKALVPVWKKEFTLDGEHWVEGPVAGKLPPAKAEAIARAAEPK